MIKMFEGTPGSGKSYNAIREALLALWGGKFVIANFSIKFSKREKKKGYADRFFFWENEELTIENLIRFAIEHDILAKEGHCLVIVDEAGGRYNIKQSKKSEQGQEDLKAWSIFFSQHRKLGFDFILVCQSEKQIDRQLREYIENIIRHRQVNRFGPFWLLPFKLFVAVEIWRPVRERVGAEFFILRKSVANRYDHMAMFGGYGLSEELMEMIAEVREKKKEEAREKRQGGVWRTNVNAIYTKIKTEEGEGEDGEKVS